MNIKKLQRLVKQGRVRWADPDPIPGNDYTVHFLKVNEDKESAFIQYGNCSEAEIYLSELVY